jgi:hypothetical protein
MDASTNEAGKPRKKAFWLLVVLLLLAFAPEVTDSLHKARAASHVVVIEAVDHTSSRKFGCAALPGGHAQGDLETAFRTSLRRCPEVISTLRAQALPHTTSPTPPAAKQEDREYTTAGCDRPIWHCQVQPSNPSVCRIIFFHAQTKPCIFVLSLSSSKNLDAGLVR